MWKLKKIITSFIRYIKITTSGDDGHRKICKCYKHEHHRNDVTYKVDREIELVHMLSSSSFMAESQNRSFVSEK